MAKKKKGPNAKILLALSKMTVPQKVSLCRSVAKAGAANAGTFSSPPVPPAAVDAAATKLEQAEAAGVEADHRQHLQPGLERRQLVGEANICPG